MILQTRLTGGFTLIELLIVVAIISILASIAVPNFTEAQLRTKIARVMADQRTLSYGVDLYMIDNTVYPVRCTPNEYLPTLATQKGQMKMITTPIVYLSSLPPDIFAESYLPPNNGIDYYDPQQTSQFIAPLHSIPAFRWSTVPESGSSLYVFVSVGPDGAIGAPSENYLDYPKQGGAMRTAWQIYDPTNGSVSYGNIFRFRDNRPAHEILFRR